MIRPLYDAVAAGVSCTIQVGVTLWRIGVELVRLNYELVTALLRTVQDVIDVTVALVIMFSGAVSDIIFHMLEFLCHFGAAVYYYAEALYYLSVPVCRGCIRFALESGRYVGSVAGVWCENGAAWLLRMYQALSHHADRLMRYLTEQSRTHRVTLPSPGVPTPQEAAGTDPASLTVTDPPEGPGFPDTESSGEELGDGGAWEPWLPAEFTWDTEPWSTWLGDRVHSAVTDIRGLYQDLLESCSTGTLSLGTGRLPHVTRTLGLATLLSAFILVLSGLLLKAMRSKGLTVPFLNTSHTSLDTSSREPDLFSDTENEQEEEEEGDESTAESGGDNSDVEELSLADSDDDDDGEDNDDISDTDDVIIVNIQLPERRVTRSVSRRSPSPLPSLPGNSALTSPELLQRVLETEKDKQRCVVCQDSPKTVLVLPCRHMCLCVDCAHEIASSRRRERKICPLCRTRMETVMNVYT